MSVVIHLSKGGKMPKPDNNASQAIIVQEPEEVEASNLAAPAEVLPPDPAQQAAQFQRTIERLVEQKVAEVIAGGNAIFQPFFQSQQITNAIRRLQNVDEQQKYAHYFEDYGCFVCERRDTRHESLGMCPRCYRSRAQRMRATVRKHAKPDGPKFIDSVKLAREALEPSLLVLAGRGSVVPSESVQGHTHADQARTQTLDSESSDHTRRAK
jgi:hypothetical protein